MKGTPERYKIFGVIILLIVLSFVFTQEIFAQTGTLTGFVKAEGGQGIENILVNVSPALPMPLPPFLGSTDSNGQYTISGITPGEYIVYFNVGMMNYVPEYYDNQNAWGTATKILIIAGETLNLEDAILSLGGTLSGTITDEVTTTGLPNINIMVFDYSASPPNIFPIYQSMSFPDGSYSITVPPGDYKLQFCPSPQGGNYLCEYYNDVTDFNSAMKVTAAVNTPTTIDAALTKGETISGIIRDEVTTTGLPNINIMVFDANAIPPNIFPIYNGMTNNLGQYSITVPPGDYKLQFCPSPSGGPYLCEYYNDKTDFNSAMKVEVTADVPKIVDAALAKGATISGTITDEVTTTWLPNINIMVFDYSASPPNIFPIYGGMTNNLGQYSITVPPGDYKLQFCPSPQGGPYLCEYYNGVTDFNSAMKVTAAVNTPTTIDAALTKGATISGIIRDEGTSTGLPNINIMVFDYSASPPNIFPIYGGMTNNLGQYSITVLPGDYKLQFCPSPQGGPYLCEYYNGVTDFNSAMKVTAAVNTPTTIDAALTKGATISGIIRDEGTSTGLPNINIMVFDPGASPPNIFPIYSGMSFPNGSYSITVPPGTYKLQFCPFPQQGSPYLCEYYDDKTDFNSATPVTVAVNTPTTIDAALTKGETISGTITEYGTTTALPSINIMVFDSNAPNTPPYNGMTNNLGQYSITVPPGTYKLQFCPSPSGGPYLCEYYNDKTDFNSATPVTVAVNTPTTIDAALTKGATISGIITEEGTSTGLPNIIIMVFDPGASPPNIFPIYSGMSFPNGSYSITVPPGTYKLRFCPSPQPVSPYLCEYYDDKTDFNSATTVTAALNTPTPINAALAKGGSISGKVSDQNTGAGLANIQVNLFNLNNVSNFGWVITGADGTYTFNQLYPGSYKIEFDPNTLVGYSKEWYNNKSYSWQADTLSVASGQSVSNINAQLGPAADKILSGYVKALNGTGISGVMMNGLPGSPKTDANGFYTSTISYGGGSGWTGRVTPEKQGLLFTPAYRDYSNLTSNQTNQNYTADLGPFHPADTSSDYRMVIKEVTGYGKAWKKNLSWPIPPSPPTKEYLTKAISLWRNGEFYHYDPAYTPPWASGPQTNFILESTPTRSHLANPVLGITITREIPSNYKPLVPILIKLTVVPDPGTDVYAVEESPPAGWTISEINEDGFWDGITKKIKWGPFFEDTPIILTYKAIPPAGETGEVVFNGTTSSDGNENILPPATMDVTYRIYLPLTIKP